MYKLYMMRFTDVKTCKQFYKFGWTSHRDALERFKDDVYKDFEIECIASLTRQSLGEIKVLEAALLTMFPKNIWLETYLGDDREWTGFSGITEIVAFKDEQEYHKAREFFYNLKNKLQYV